MSRPALALFLLILFHVIAFGLRSWQQYRRTGSTGFRGLSGRPGSLEWLGGVLFVVGIVLGPAAALGELFGWIAPLWQPSPIGVVAGVVIVLSGIAATYAAQTRMGASWRIGVQQDERTELVTTGVFALVRNPIFSSVLWTAVGLVGLLPNALAIASLLCVLLAVELQVRLVEEPYLLRTHGQRYCDYAGRVGRFVPGLGRLQT
jgi:protein-S-isoprenylcysteine O-methyltransferase Ste14